MTKTQTKSNSIWHWRVSRSLFAPRRDLVAKVEQQCVSLREVDAAELASRSRSLRKRVILGENQNLHLADAFALVRVAAERFANQSHYPVQLEAGAALVARQVAEMQTGEGKTLTALLPAYFFALENKGSHVVTANDYLARRDAEFARKVLGPLGLQIGCVTSDVEPSGRKSEYACDVTFGTSREFGFDFLRDRLAKDSESSSESVVQRGQHFALVDEADSVLLDDAMTPLIIALAEEQSAEESDALRWLNNLMHDFAINRDYIQPKRRNSIELTDAGCQRLRHAPKPPVCSQWEIEQLFHQATCALVAQRNLQRDRDYIVERVEGEEQVAIVDETTGRVAEGRKWRDGLQQAIEIKEGVPLSPQTLTAARCTLQSYFLRYRHLAGLTGTASTAAGEFKSVYRLNVQAIPTHRPCVRRELPPRVFAKLADKLEAIASDLADRQAAGGATLVGTPSVHASEKLSQLLHERGLVHQVLNCRVHEQEAQVVAMAGQPGRITIATNMAGRGTDIAVDAAVLEQGGLHVVVTELHSSRRIDRQLIGRTARQGEPGSYQIFLSLEDELLDELSERELLQVQRAAAGQVELARSWYGWFRRVQRIA